MSVPIVGLCRFSFLGKGDWVAWRNEPRGQEIEQEKRKDLAASLYSPSRMAERFWTLENLLLPSIRAQTDQDFHRVILTPVDLPAIYRDRLADLVGGTPNAILEVSQAQDVSAGFSPIVDE